MPNYGGNTFPKNPTYIFVIIAIFLTGFCVAIVRNPAPAPVPQPGSGMSFRGNRIALLRMIERPPYEGIEVFADGKVIRFPYPEQSGVYNSVNLTTIEQRQIETIRGQWCAAGTPAYDGDSIQPSVELGFLCPNQSVVKARVPTDQLPPIFRTILNTLPPVQQ